MEGLKVLQYIVFVFRDPQNLHLNSKSPMGIPDENIGPQKPMLVVRGD